MFVRENREISDSFRVVGFAKLSSNAFPVVVFGLYDTFITFCKEIVSEVLKPTFCLMWMCEVRFFLLNLVVLDCVTDFVLFSNTRLVRSVGSALRKHRFSEQFLGLKFFRTNA